MHSLLFITHAESLVKKSVKGNNLDCEVSILFKHRQIKVTFKEIVFWNRPRRSAIETHMHHLALEVGTDYSMTMDGRTMYIKGFVRR